MCACVLILACQALSYLLHIHPFPDGNGRASGLFM
jgi:fido (protein-threonine AMPylation protein)